MTWFVASVLTAIRNVDKTEEKVPVFEDFFLVEADAREQALQEAEKIGREVASLQDGLSLDGKPAERIFLGIRKLRSVYNPAPFDIDEDQPVHGTELTHSYYEVDDFESAIKLGRGECVQVTYLDDAEGE